MVTIHPTAIVESGAELDEGVVIGAFSYIGKQVKIGKNTVIKQGAVIEGDTSIGEECTIFGATIGVEPQDLKYKGEPSKVIIGNRVTVREYVTIHRGTEGGGLVTKIGDNVLLMAYAHIAHDVIIGNNVIIANSVQVAGHVVIDDFAIVGGLTGIHQFVRIGKHAMVGGASAVHRDVPPFTMAQGNRARLTGINIVGLKRRGFSRKTIRALTATFEKVFKTAEPIQISLSEVEEEFKNFSEVIDFVNFIRSSKRGICPA
ncbi:Acyl-(acyl-carrier-protein)--UDP-N-acetylglucosamine O-acyltransferase [Desulfurobacterium thermolithotrophum DSM 11699]|uniref:Acyl-[acyl-carrier-protein]--UDP-N-acetylglucosamine O-acyltransferase n=1 Tax=Desulfurobacterium thermolithotrophum (strain DSM 11699 / BSA) TaxID=868864 RepID=F0S2Z6_DESTD|nr:acyl-ACP--UDP-N-acetylglucosamine O-acyltransferase [Desulfurobacterium thermolithotrophum]ADY73218.1 Acyl-(acyl-carrier-protein)--UDP-N-acetylglucosamine O-acyltransferase [Desulfurobacterium thermolithotrophum DSM 11699]